MINVLLSNVWLSDVMVICKKNIYFIVWIASWTSLFFHDIKIFLGENDWQIVLFSGLGARQIFSQKWMKPHLGKRQGKQLTLVVNDTIWVLSKNYCQFQKLVSVTGCLTASDKTESDITKQYLSPIVKWNVSKFVISA